MAWHTEMIIILRTLIDDLSDTSPEFTDDRLKELLAVAGRYVLQEIEFKTTYTVDINPPLINPDPSTNNTDGDVFINFVTLKAACIVDRAPLRKRVLIGGIEARCGPAVMKTIDHIKGFKELLSLGYCGVYDTTREQYILGNVAFAKAVLSPFVNETFDPTDLALIAGRSFGHHDYRI